MERKRFRELMTKEGYPDDVINGVWKEKGSIIQSESDDFMEKYIKKMSQKQQFKLTLVKFAQEELEKLESKLN